MAEKEFDRVKLNPISTNQLSSLIVGEEGLPKNVGQAGDPELNYLTEGNIPISEQEMKTREIRNKFGTMKDEILEKFDNFNIKVNIFLISIHWSITTIC